MDKQIIINENGINMVFEVTDDKELLLLHMSAKPYIHEIEEKHELAYRTVDIVLTGIGHDDIHGEKHTGGLALKYVSHSDTLNSNGRLLSFKLSHEEIEVYMNYQFYNGISVVKSWAVVKNISNENIGIEYISSFSYGGLGCGDEINNNMDIYIPHMGWCKEYNWQKYSLEEAGFVHRYGASTKRISASNTGAWSTKGFLPMACIENRSTGTSYMWQIENNGSWNWEVSDMCNCLYVKLSGPSEHENNWWKNLRPGQEFISVPTAVTVGEGGFDKNLEEITKYRRTVKRYHRADTNKNPVIFNDYLNCLMADPTTEKLIPVIERAAKTGAEYFCMDAGWYADGQWWDTVGEWQPCAWRFPNGIEEVAERVRSKGMIFGMWIEIEVMGVSCPLAAEFDDDCFFMRHGKRVVDHGRYQLDFRNEKVRNFATGVIDRLVNDYSLGYMKIDYNIDPGVGTEVDADSFGDGLLKANRAFIKWIGSVMDRYPDLIIEACASGGMRIDYATMANFPLVSVSDQSSNYRVPDIAAGAATAVLPEQAAVWAFPAPKMCDDEIIYCMAGAMLTRMHLSGKIPWLSEEQFKYVKKSVDVYKEIRDTISTSIPFYPLGLSSYDEPYLCAGYKNYGFAYITVWNNSDDGADIKLPIHYKKAEIIYSAEDVMAEADGREVIVHFPRKRMAAVIKVEE